MKRTNQVRVECNDLDTNASKLILFLDQDNQGQHRHKLSEMLWTQWLENVDWQLSNIQLHMVKHLYRHLLLLRLGIQPEVLHLDCRSLGRQHNEQVFHQDQKWLFSHDCVLMEGSLHAFLWSMNQEEVKLSWCIGSLKEFKWDELYEVHFHLHLLTLQAIQVQFLKDLEQVHFNPIQLAQSLFSFSESIRLWWQVGL